MHADGRPNGPTTCRPQRWIKRESPRRAGRWTLSRVGSPIVGRPPTGVRRPRSGLCLVRDDGHLVAVFQAGPAGARKLWCNRGDQRRRGTLLSGHHEDLAGLSHLRVVVDCRLRDVPLRPLVIPPGITARSRRCHLLPAARCPYREQHVGGLGLAVGGPLVVRAPVKVDVVEDDRRADVPPVDGAPSSAPT